MKNIENVMQSIASEAYKKTARPAVQNGEENSGSFQREYLQVLVRDYFYSGYQTEAPKEKLVHLQKLKASIDSLQLPADFMITKSTEEISLGNFMKLLEEEMASFEENKEEKLKQEKEKLKELKEEEIENIVMKAKGKLTLGDVERYRQGHVKEIERSQLPAEVISQISKHFENHGIKAGAEHEAIASSLLEKGIELSDTVCHNIDALLTAKNKEISQERIEELAKQYASVQKIDLAEWNKEYPLSAKQVEELVHQIQGLDDDYQQKIGRNFKTIEEALDNYRNFKTNVLQAKATNSDELSRSQISFQYIRYKMTLEKALTLNSRGIPIDKAELATIEKELLRLEISAEQLEQAAGARAVSTDTLLTEMLDVEHGLMDVMGSDYGSLSQMMTNFTFKQVRGISAANQAATALNRYDNLGTKVRSDLGDSMNKAFQRLNSLLLANDIEATDENLRAAAILGRGQVEITWQNIENIKELDQKLQLVLRGLTPEAILDLWADDRDILAMTIEELTDYVDIRETKELKRLSDRVAKKINQLEKSGQIDEAEKERLILAYRLLHLIEKSEGGAVAVLMKDQRALSLENLYDMARYLEQQTSIDQKIGPEEGLADEQNYHDLKAQIRGSYLNKKREIREIFQAAENTLLGDSAEEVTQAAKDRLQLLRNFSLREWEELFRAWKEPNMKDIEIYKDFQKIPFLLTDTLRKLEKVSQRHERAKQKLEALKEMLDGKTSVVNYEQVKDLLREMEAEVITGRSQEEKEILAALSESKKQWDYQQKFQKYHEFMQIPVWNGQHLHQINIYYPGAKRETVKEQGEIKVLLAFETTQSGKISGFLQASPVRGELIFQGADSQEWLSRNKSEICRIFAQNQFPLTSLSVGTFLEATPYQNQAKGLKEVKGEEMLTEADKIYPEKIEISELEEKMVSLAKDLAGIIF